MHVSAVLAAVRPTCQSVVDHVVLVPQPQDLLHAARHRVQTDGRRLLKVSAALLAAKERPDVSPHHLQHRRRLALQTWAMTTGSQTGKHVHGHVTGVCITCVLQSGGRGTVLDGQNMKQSPQGTWVTS